MGKKSLLLCLALCALLWGCQGESPSQASGVPSAPAQSSAASAVASEEPAPSPTASPVATPSPEPASAPQAGEEHPQSFSSDSPLAPLENQEGEFSLPGFSLGATLWEVQAQLALTPDAPELELMREENDVHFGTRIAQYRMGTMELGGRDFTRELTFWDDRLDSVELVLDAQEGEDLAPLYQELWQELDQAFGLEDQVELPGPILDAATDETYDSQRFGSATSGDTKLTLTASLRGERTVQVKVTVMQATGN